MNSQCIVTAGFSNLSGKSKTKILFMLFTTHMEFISTSCIFKEGHLSVNRSEQLLLS